MTTLEDRIAKLEALVERQAVVIAEKDAVIARLQQRVSELERRLGERGGGEPASGAAGGGARREPSGRRPGGQPGHKGNRRDLLPDSQVTRAVDCFPSACRGCGKKLRRDADESPLRHQVVDVPPIAPDVTEFRQHRVTCGCGVITCGPLCPPAPPPG